jgi:transcriptional regulator with XRE-family HTH domain
MGTGKGRGRVSRETLARRKKVGEFLRRRRLELGLSQGDMIRLLMYKNRNSISNVEIGIEGLPLKRVYQYAEVLKLPRDDFFRFVLGELEDLALTGYQRARLKDQREKTLTDAEQDLVDNFRRLSKKYQDRVREHVCEYLVIEGKQALSGSRLRRLGSRRRAATS